MKTLHESAHSGAQRNRQRIYILVAVAAGISACHDPRVSLNEFIAMRNVVMTPEASSQPAPTAVLPTERALPPYRVGPGDVLGLTLIGLNGTTDTTILRVRVNREGEISLPLVGAIKVDGMEIEDVERAVAKRFVDEQIVKTMSVNAEVATYDVTEVVVMGAVALPGLTQLHRNERDVLHAVGRASGLSDASSGKVKLTRLMRPTEEQTFDLSNPADVKAALALPPLESGDRIMVEAAAPNTIFVGGLVMAPGPKSFPAGTTVNVLQILAASGGVKEDVYPTEATLIRRMADGKDVQVKLNLERLRKGQDPNIVLAAGDIFWVPETAGTRFWDFVNKHVNFNVGVGTSYDPVQFERYGRLERQQEWNFRNTKRAAFLNPLSGIGGQQVINPFNFLGFTATPITPVVPATTGGS